MTLYIIGHNDPGYPPDETPVQAPTWPQAIACVKSMIQSYFLVELDEEELTIQDIRAYQCDVVNMKPNSTRILRHHAFWIHPA